MNDERVTWCAAGHMIEVEGGHNDWCAACEREQDMPPAGWLNPPARWLQERERLSPLTLQDESFPLPMAGSWGNAIPRTIGEVEQAARRAQERMGVAQSVRRVPVQETTTEGVTGVLAAPRDADGASSSA